MSIQGEKKYGSDHAKAKSRELVKDMIDRTLLDFKRPEDLRVLCLPGRDVAEVIQVYDALGIPRENITGIEREEDAAQHIRDKAPEIELYHGELSDFITQYQGSFPFNVISLDYTGPISVDQLVLENRVLSNTSENHLVLHNANLAKRDHNSKNLYLMGFAQTDIEGSMVPEQNALEWAANEEKRRIDRAIQLHRTFEKGDSMDVKPTAYASIISAAYRTARNYSELMDDIYKFVFSGRKLEGVLSKLEEKYTDGKKLNRDKPITHLMSEFTGDSAPASAIIDGFYRAELEKRFKSRAMGNGIAEALLEAYGAIMFQERDLEVYHYISRSAAPMVGEVAFLSHPERRIELAKDLRRIITQNGILRVDPSKGYEAGRALMKVVREGAKTRPMTLVDQIHRKITNPTNLGSSALPVLTKKRAIEAFRNGDSIAKVRENFRAIGNKPLAAWKAHVTMGTYDEAAPKQEKTPQEGVTDILSEEEAKELLGSGVPSKEILEAYPGSFTLSQLSGFKAWISRRKNEGKVA